jgi:hypothetical protein
MRFIKLLLSTAVFASAIFGSLSPAAFAYNGWDMQRDQQTVNQLAQEGVLSPNAAMYLDNKAANKVYGSWWQNGVSPMLGTGPAVGVAMPILQSPGQLHREDRQIDRLERDGVMSRRQGNILKSEINSQQNMIMTGASPLNRPWNSGYFYTPTQMIPAQVVPAQMIPTQTVPTAYPVNYVQGGGYCNNTNMPLWARLHNVL